MRIRDRIKALRRIPARQLRHNPHKWKRRSDSQATALRRSLERLGYVGALIAREVKGGRFELLDGHLRADLTPDTKVPVLIVELDDKEAAEVVATYDPLGAMAEADGEALEALRSSLGLDDKDLDAMLQKLIDEAPQPAAADGLADPDDVPAPPEKAITHRGDVWLLGKHRLLCGDSSKPEDLDQLLGGARIHLVNMDPPYNVKVEPRSNNAIAAGLSSFKGPKHHQAADLARHPEKAKPTNKRLRPKDRPLANDFVTDAEFDRLLLAWFGNAARVLLPGRGFYIWGGYSNCGNYPPAIAASELYFSQAIIWVKHHPVLTRKDFMGDHEWCFYGWREGAPHVFLGPNNATDVWEVQKVNPTSMVHLTEKPVELAARALSYSTRSGEHVLDLFGGSGSTLIAAQQLRRRAFLMELDPLYCDVIVRRWEKFTGKKAVRQTRKPKAD